MALAKMLHEQGQILIEARPAGNSSLTSFTLRRPSSLGSIAGFLRELRSFVRAGIPLSRALDFLASARGETFLGAAAREVRQKIGEGMSLDEAMALHPSIFDSLTCSIVRAGIASGGLEIALAHLVGFLELRQNLERKVRRAMGYPVFLLFVLFVVMTILMLFVLPRFSELYKDFGAELPLLTRALLVMVDAAPVAVPSFLAATLGIFGLLRLWLRAPSARVLFDRFKLEFPLVGPILLNRHLVQTSFVISLMLDSGLQLRAAVREAARGSRNEVVRARLEMLAEHVTAGRPFAESLATLDFFPSQSLNLLAAGEACGELAAMFTEVGEAHKQVLEDRLAAVLSLIEPMMMITVGIVLGTTIIAVYLPIFGIAEVIG